MTSDLFGYELPAIGSTNDLRVHAKQIGECGVALTVFYLRDMGFPACEATDTCQYDLTVGVGGPLLRVQVKSTSKSNEAGTFHFNHKKGHRSTQLGVRPLLVESPVSPNFAKPSLKPCPSSWDESRPRTARPIGCRFVVNPLIFKGRQTQTQVSLHAFVFAFTDKKSPAGAGLIG